MTVQVPKPRRRTIYSVTRSFRVTDTISEGIDDLADVARKHPSELIRDAVTRFVIFYKKHPDQLSVTP